MGQSSKFSNGILGDNFDCKNYQTTQGIDLNRESNKRVN